MFFANPMSIKTHGDRTSEEPGRRRPRTTPSPARIGTGEVHDFKYPDKLVCAGRLVAGVIWTLRSMLVFWNRPDDDALTDVPAGALILTLRSAAPETVCLVSPEPTA